MTIIYVAGPMSGIKDHNRPLFNMAAAELADQGHSVLNPATLPDGLSQGQYMQICLPMVAVADELVMLPGWEQSEGHISSFAWPRSQARRSGNLAGAFCMKGENNAPLPRPAAELVSVVDGNGVVRHHRHHWRVAIPGLSAPGAGSSPRTSRSTCPAMLRNRLAQRTVLRVSSGES